VWVTAGTSQLALAPQPGAKEGIAFGRQADGDLVCVIATGAVLQEREHRSRRCGAVSGFQPGAEAIAVGLGGALKGFCGRLLLGDDHQLGEKAGDQVLIEFCGEIGDAHWHSGLSMPYFREEVERFRSGWRYGRHARTDR
jgi:hypothetical protein